MRQCCPVERCDDKHSCVRSIGTRRCMEGHSPPPTCWGLWVNAAENYPTLSNGPFDDCGGSVWILADNLTPPGKLRAVLPILIECWPFSHSNPHRCLAGTIVFGGVEAEF